MPELPATEPRRCPLASRSLTTRLPAPLALALALLASLALFACSATGPREPAAPVSDQFFQAPGGFAGQVVRLTRMRTLRIDPTRPLLFAVYDAPERELTVSDARGLTRQGNIRQHQVVTVVFRCTEGQLDRGNLLVAIE